MVDLPPFPTDEGTLSLLEAAMDTEAEQSSTRRFLDLMSTLGGSDTNSDRIDGAHLVRGPVYTEHCVITALIEEVRRLRGAT